MQGEPTRPWVVVHSTFMVQSIYGAIQKYAGMERPEWLDL
jgi:hypothetical protein